MYTRSKSACRNSRALRGKQPRPDRGSTSRFDSPGTLAVTLTLSFQIAAARRSARWQNRHCNKSGHLGWDAAFLRATGLFAETWFYRDPLAPLGAPAGNYFLAALGLHARAKSVHLRSLAPVGLECTLGQSHSLLIASTVLRQTVSINHKARHCQTVIGSRRRMHQADLLSLRRFSHLPHININHNSLYIRPSLELG